ncbi:MAG: hypothetical protein KDD50_05770 [Bdellovibrionales bacterium]|nr:hypothetical protein [Bdellovibrionales bacterium]
MFYRFEDLDLSDKKLSSSFGGKGYILSLLTQRGYQVPSGAILTALPTEQEWKTIEKWWAQKEFPKLAVRSSALGEDSAQFSFAGQNVSHLNVDSLDKLHAAVKSCFDSIKKISSTTYRKYLLDTEDLPEMNVVLQEMVSPLFAGVFFSSDPRGKSKGWMYEVVEGLGESLVSGAVTPEKVMENFPSQVKYDRWEKEFGDKIVEAGINIKKTLNYEVDVEWAIDEQGKFYVLQARPITALDSTSSYQTVIDYELTRLKQSDDQKTMWDGKTFAEWNGFPSYFTFSIWKKAFSPHFSFGDALKKLGYLSFIDKPFSPKDSVLERVFGRAYLNLKKVGDLYYGPIPYRITPLPRPHLRFDLSKVTLGVILHFPFAIYRMLKVAWIMSTKRQQLLTECRSDLLKMKTKLNRPQDPTMYSNWSRKELIERLVEEESYFAKHVLFWPFVLIFLTESTLQSLESILSGVFGKEQGNKKIQHWMSIGLKTISFEMNKMFNEATGDGKKQKFFMARYGHRGPGELDLVNPRWLELGEKAFFSTGAKKNLNHKYSTKAVDREIEELQTFKKSIIKQEWNLLRQMLELREQWKMDILRPYAHIRYILEEIGKQVGLGKDIHWLRLSEILPFANEVNKESLIALKIKIEDRKRRFNIFKKVSLPDVVSLEQIELSVSGKGYEKTKLSQGAEALSPGLAFGEVRVVNFIEDVNTDEWPENVILVARSTDPGWTPLFAKAAGVIVEKGGVLSHCAIVAREMGLPAISGVPEATHILKDGDKVWVDGNGGKVGYDV